MFAKNRVILSDVFGVTTHTPPPRAPSSLAQKQSCGGSAEPLSEEIYKKMARPFGRPFKAFEFTTRTSVIGPASKTQKIRT